MGLLNNNENKLGGTYFDITEQPKGFRPLAKDTTSVWVHSVPGITTVGPDGQPKTLRKYATEICVSTGRSGAGCTPCLTPDPMWDKVDAKTKYNKKGLRTDFPKKMAHLLPVLDLTTGKTIILKGGNQLFEDMAKWLQSQPENGRDLRRCEWQAWKSGKGMTTKYNTVRLDATNFQATPEMEAEAAEMIQKALADMAPMKLEAFMATVAGDATSQEPNQAAVQVPSFPNPSVVAAPTAQTIPQQPAVTFTAPVPPAAPAPVVTAPVAPPAANVMEEFTQWCNSQPEFQGMGTFNNLIPVLQEKIGSVNYHACTPEQLTTLKAALTAKLEGLRKKA